MIEIWGMGDENKKDKEKKLQQRVPCKDDSDLTVCVGVLRCAFLYLM